MAPGQEMGHHAGQVGGALGEGVHQAKTQQNIIGVNPILVLILLQVLIAQENIRQNVINFLIKIHQIFNKFSDFRLNFSFFILYRTC